MNGWRVGAVATIDTGFPYEPTISTERSFDGIQIAQNPGDHANLNTASSTLYMLIPSTPGGPAPTVPAGESCSATLGAINTVSMTPATTPIPNCYQYSFVPYNASTVTAAPFGTPNQWFNPLMFGIPALGQLGNAGRDILWGPGLGQLDLNITKDTKAGFLGEAGSIEFRAEIFNLLNHPNFALPNAASIYNTSITSATATSYPFYCPVGTFSKTGAQGTACNVAPGNSVYPGSSSTTSLATPYGTIGQITSTTSSSRQIQLALKFIF